MNDQPTYCDGHANLAELSAIEAGRCAHCLAVDLTARAERAEAEVERLRAFEEQVRNWSASDGPLSRHILEACSALDAARSRTTSASTARDCRDGTDADEPADRGFVCEHDAQPKEGT